MQFSATSEKQKMTLNLKFLFLCLKTTDLQRMSDLAVLTLQSMSVAVNKPQNGSRSRFSVFIYCERKHNSTAFFLI